MFFGHREVVRYVGAACLSLLLGCGARGGLALDEASLDSNPDTPNNPERPTDPGTGGGGNPSNPCGTGSPSDDLPRPILHYRFDGNTQNAGTLGGNFRGNDVSVSYGPGKFSEAALVGSPSWIELPGTARILQRANALTIAMWIVPDFSTWTFPLIDCRSELQGFQTYHGVAGERRLTTCFGAGAPSIGPGGCESIDLPSDGWHHLLYRSPAKGGPVEMVVDNELVATLEGGRNFDMFGGVVNDIWLGKNHEGSGWEPGHLHRIDDLRIYDRAFDARDQCEHVIGGGYCDGRCYLP